jgi:hypothetical protein
VAAGRLTIREAENGLTALVIETRAEAARKR